MEENYFMVDSGQGLLGVKQSYQIEEHLLMHLLQKQ